MNDITDLAPHYAEAFNQYRRRIGAACGMTVEEAIAGAKEAARQEIATTNPNWKWRIAKVRCFPNPFKREVTPG